MMKILFLAYNPTSLVGVLYVIEQLKKEIDFVPVLACSGCYYETNDFDVINFEEKGFHTKRQGTQKQNLSTWYNEQNRSLLYQLKLFFKTYRNMSKMDVLARQTGERINPDYWIVTDDRVGGMHMALLKYAKKGHVIRFPAAVQADFNVSFYNREFDSSLVVDRKKLNVNRIQQKIDSKLVHSISNESRVFYQTGEALAYELLGMLPHHPWASGASKCDYVLTVSNGEKKRVLEEAYPRIIKVEVTGLPEDYYIVHGNKLELDIREKYKYLGEKIVVIAIPQIAEHNEVPWEVHRSNMKVLCKWVSERYGKVLFSLHPKSRREDYVFLEKEGLGYICDEKLAEIIRFSDLLICSENSSVREWAPLLGIERLLLVDNSLKTKISSCDKIFASDNMKTSISFREGKNVKKISSEIIRAMDYLKRQND